MNLSEIAIAILTTIGFFFLIWTAWSAMMTPVWCKRGSVYTVLRIDGHCPEMEQTVDGLIWLKKNGVLENRIIIVDCGMDSETSEIAARLAKKYGKVTVCDIEKLEAVIAEEQ